MPVMPTEPLIFDVDRTTVKVDEFDHVFRQVRGEWKPLTGGMLVAKALRKASNLRALRRSAAERELRHAAKVAAATPIEYEVRFTAEERMALTAALADIAQDMDDDGREGAFDASPLGAFYRKLREARRAS